MKNLNHLNTKDIHQPFSNYTHCVEVTSPSKFLFCSGQVPATKDGKLLGADNFGEQGKLVFGNIKKVLSNSDAELTDVVRLVTYLCREEDVPKIRGLLELYFPVNPPANTVCIVKD